MTQFKPFKHQRDFAELWAKKERLLNFSGCGVGKTLACIYAIRTNWPEARVLVLAPLSILKNAWAKDLEFGWPNVTYELAYAKNRKQAFESDAQWIITNHDAIKDVVKNDWADKFDVCIIDEGDVFRNGQSQRSKAMLRAAGLISKLVLMTGTPSPKTVLDVWHLALLVDFGQRLGNRFFSFRDQMCTPKPIPGVAKAFKWDDKPNANIQVTAWLSDITHRVELNDVVELPETITREIQVEIPHRLRVQYDFLKKESMVLMESGENINALHAGSRVQKLMQMVSGAVYDEMGVPKDLHPDRHKLVLDLVQETDHALVAFNWTHQRAGLEKEAKARQKAGMLGEYAVIDGSVSVAKRNQIVERFQNGDIQVIFAQPQSAGHGLTLTKANRVIWASPTYRADLYEQFNHRIVRTGQKRRTEIIHIAADNTIEQDVYEQLMNKKLKMEELLMNIALLGKAA